MGPGGGGERLEAGVRVPAKHPENHKNAVVLRVGHKGEAITQFELFRYT